VTYVGREAAPALAATTSGSETAAAAAETASRILPGRVLEDTSAPPCSEADVVSAGASSRKVAREPEYGLVRAN